MERTLTGKKAWQSKEERMSLALTLQKQRDEWEKEHIGNYCRAFPSFQESQKEKYQLMLNQAMECYLSLTGGSNCAPTQTSYATPRRLFRLTPTVRPRI